MTQASWNQSHSRKGITVGDRTTGRHNVRAKKDGSTLPEPPSFFARLTTALGLTHPPQPLQPGRGADPVKLPGTSAPSEAQIREQNTVTRPRQHAGSETINVNARSQWRAYREAGSKPFTNMIVVKGMCTLPSGYEGSRFVLQEAVLSANREQQWGSSATGGSSSPILNLERVLIPAPLEVNDRVDTKETKAVEVVYRREETSDVQGVGGIWSTNTTGRNYTHITILPDRVIIPIENRVL